MQAWVAGAQAALEASGAAIRPYFRAGTLADDKSDESPVTVADRKAKQILRESLLAAFPDCGIIGEEFPPHRPDQKYTWVIDPIDGTRAFITGRTSFCTLLGLLEDGVPVLGFHRPADHARALVGRAQCGGRLQGRIRRPAGHTAEGALAEAEFSSTAPEMFTPAQMARLDRLKGAAKRVYWGGDAYAYGLLALGQIDVVAECSLKPWDWAALGPVVEAAGGVVSDWRGRPLKLGVTEGDVVAAANAGLHREALAALG